jgi:CBS domain containing-hemolysin-like protein
VRDIDHPEKPAALFNVVLIWFAQHLVPAVQPLQTVLRCLQGRFIGRQRRIRDEHPEGIELTLVYQLSRLHLADQPPYLGMAIPARSWHVHC